MSVGTAGVQGEEDIIIIVIYTSQHFSLPFKDEPEFDSYSLGERGELNFNYLETSTVSSKQISWI